MTITYNTTVLKGRGLRKEGIAAGAVSPGDLIEVTNNAGVLNYQRQSVAGGVCEKLFAVENEVFGKGLDTDYTNGPPADVILAESCYAGMEVFATVAIGAAAIVIGDKLEPAGDGTLRKIGAGDQPANLADNTGGAASGVLALLTLPDLSAWNGATDPSAAQATAIGAAFTVVKNSLSSIAAQLNKVTGIGSGHVIAIARDAIDNSAGAAKVRVRVSLL